MVSVVEGGSFRGRDGVERYFRESESTWDELLVLGEDFRDLGDRVVVLGRTQGRGRGSGVRSETNIGMVCDLRDRRLTCVRAYLDHDETLRAAGLES
jgi:ketosteroid isomerase-like protein